MHSMLSVPMELQLQMHQQMLYRQEQIALRRHRPDENHGVSGWAMGSLPLPADVKVELHNHQLWQEFHAENTEMIITKSGRRMFPSVQLNVSGLERRARYCVLLEVAPASDRRHKYVGSGANSNTEEISPSNSSSNSNRGWTSAGPAEPQPRIDRRIYLHPDSPAPGAHWMQHPVSFNKLKLTNNAVDSKNNVVLTSMHKYIPRIWIIRCDDLSRIRDFYSHPASSFTFKETEFIAVTAYQNESITKLKIDNNPFAKGFRESGQSRSKRKFQQVEGGERSTQVDDEEGTVSSSESDSRTAPHLETPQRPKTASSEASSADDCLSSCGGVSPPLDNSPLRVEPGPEPEADPEMQPRLHRPWVDPPAASCRNNPLTPSSNSQARFHPSRFPLPPYYFSLFQPSSHFHSDLASHYPLVTQFSKFH